MALAQEEDALKNSMLEKIKSNAAFKEKIYEFKGEELPAFELTLLNGEEFHSESLKGKPTVINFWFTNCAPCIEEMPLLNELQSAFAPDVNFLSITFDKPSEVNAFLKNVDFNFTHIAGAKTYLKSFGFFGYPKTLILDENLVIREIEKMIPKDTVNEKQHKADFKERISDYLIELIRL